MNETVQFLARHGYWMLIGAVLGRQACLPIPANLVLVAAGALAHSGKLSLSGIVILSVLTFLFADLAWYEAGRRWGDKILHLGCGLSGDTGSCVHKANAVFSKYGVRTLLLSKFVPGFDAVAAPLVGNARISAIKFLFFDAVGAAFWTSAYAALGYIFSEQLDRVAAHVLRMGAVLTLAVVAGLGFYLVRRFARWLRFLRQFNLTRITPEQLRDRLNAGENLLLIDLQAHKKPAHEQWAIPGAVRVSPRALERGLGIEIAPAQEVVLYCSCPGEFTSARVALALHQKGIDHVRPLAGGLRAWRESGFPVTSEILFPAASQEKI
jgi:membrane protein DedA with SNARE-associated domain/rhodanese-related sulfurtransferase